MQDPFDDKDNCARAIGAENYSNGGTMQYIAFAFRCTTDMLAELPSIQEAQQRFVWLFGPEAVVHLPAAVTDSLGIPAPFRSDLFRKCVSLLAQKWFLSPTRSFAVAAALSIN